MRLTARILLFVLTLGVAGYAMVAYTTLPLGAAVHPDMRAGFQAHPVGVYTHVFGAAVAMALGPFQFVRGLRARRPALHRLMGRLYLGVGVLVGGLAGLYIARFAYGGMVSVIGFAALAVAWLFTGLRAFLAIRAGDVPTHRRWMIRNLALTLAAVMLRIYIPASVIAGVAFDAAYPIIAWLCWVPNVLVAESIVARTARA